MPASRNPLGTHVDKVLALVQEEGVLRARDLDAHGIPREILRRLVSRGQLVQPAHGLYMLVEADLGEHVSLATACKRVPHGVVCLLSALRFHNMTTQAPFEVWMAIDHKAWLPRVEGLPLRIFYFSGPALRTGIETVQEEGASIRVYNPAKTVADCFKYRNKIGLDVAIEALSEYRRKKLGTADELWYHARVCRVAQVMRPYLEVVG